MWPPSAPPSSASRSPWSKAQTLGGTCLNVGCIPSKALIHAAEAFAQAKQQASGKSALGIKTSGVELDLATTLDWKDGIVAKLTGGVGALLKKHGVTVIKGWAEVIDGKTVEIKQPGAEAGDSPQRVQCEHLLLAAGSQEIELPFLPFGAGHGRVVSSTEALAFAEVPKHLVVVGGGYIGLELGTVWRKLGAEVTVVEAQDRILPAYDAGPRQARGAVAGQAGRQGADGPSRRGPERRGRCAHRARPAGRAHRTAGRQDPRRRGPQAAHFKAGAWSA